MATTQPDIEPFASKNSAGPQPNALPMHCLPQQRCKATGSLLHIDFKEAQHLSVSALQAVCSQNRIQPTLHAPNQARKMHPPLDALPIASTHDVRV